MDQALYYVNIFEYLQDKVNELKKMTGLSSYRFGLAGSCARGEQTADSDIDIVVDTDDMSLESMEAVKKAIGKDVDVLQLGLLKKEDAELDSFLQENGLPINDDSVYKTIVREVIWFE